MMALKSATRKTLVIRVFHDPNPHCLHRTDLYPDLDLTTESKAMFRDLFWVVSCLLGVG